MIGDCLPSAVHPSSCEPLHVGQGGFVLHLCMQHYVSSSAASKVLESCFITLLLLGLAVCVIFSFASTSNAAWGQQSCRGWETRSYIPLIRGFALCWSQDRKAWSEVIQRELLQALQRLRAAVPQLGFSMKSFHHIETWSFVCLDFFFKKQS